MGLEISSGQVLKRNIENDVRRVRGLIDQERTLVIAARLVLIKSRALLPQSPVVIEGEDEEDPKAVESDG